MGRLSRTTKKPKGFGKKSEDPRDAQAKTGLGITERMFCLIAARVKGFNSGKMPYFRLDHAARSLGLDYDQTRTEFERLVAMDALAKANGGSYTPTPKFDVVFAAYTKQQAAARAADQNRGGNNGKNYRRHH